MDIIKLFSKGKSAERLDICMLLLRIAFGSLMAINHGWGKLMKLFGDTPVQFADPLHIGMVPSLGLAVFAEFVCGLLIAVGLLTRLATVPLIITMLIAAFVIHFPDPFAKKELALIYLSAYVAILLLGAGKYSLDQLFFKRN